MTDIDQLKDLELIAAFARAMGYEILDIAYDADEPNVVVKGDIEDGLAFRDNWTELPSDLIIQEFDRIKPCVSWEGDICNLSAWKNNKTTEIAESTGPDFKTAMARLSVKLEEEKEK